MAEKLSWQFWPLPLSPDPTSVPVSSHCLPAWWPRPVTARTLSIQALSIKPFHIVELPLHLRNGPNLISDAGHPGAAAVAVATWRATRASPGVLGAQPSTASGPNAIALFRKSLLLDHTSLNSSVCSHAHAGRHLALEYGIWSVATATLQPQRPWAFLSSGRPDKAHPSGDGCASAGRPTMVSAR